MDLLPTGSNKLLEIQTGNIYVVIKSKNSSPNLTNKSILQQPSELRVTGGHCFPTGHPNATQHNGKQ